MRSQAIRRFILAAVIAAPLCLVGASNSSASSSEINHRAEMSIRGGHQTAAAPATKASRVRSNGINYHGGAVMTAATTNAYIIWYGKNWTVPSPKTDILTNFLGHVGGSPYFNINTTYYDGGGVHVKNSVTLGTQITDTGSQGTTNLSDAQILAIVNTAITTNALPTDPNGVYFVLTSSEVSKSGFLTSYCGWHTSATIGGASIKYSFVGDPTGPQVANCAAQTTSSPNGDVGADAMASVIAHELEEAVTDPNLNAWYDTRGYENADKCAWTFGTTYTANGALANMKIGGLDYLIQRNWVNASGGYCSLKI